MLGHTPTDLGDENGTTIVELLVGMAMGMIVLAGLTLVLIVVLHGNGRVDARVEATDNGRIAVVRIVEELHSACTAHGIAPVQGSSTENSLVFRHAAEGEATEVAPKTTESVIEYDPAAETLIQIDHTEGLPEAPPRVLLANVVPAAGKQGIFSYFEYVGREELEPLPAATAIGTRAKNVILVNVALTANPRSSPVADAGAAATAQNSATLRLTPPSSSGTEAKPCE